MEKITSRLNEYTPYTGGNRGIYYEGYTAFMFRQNWAFSNTAFDKGSDLDNMGLSVKSARFTLATTLYGDNFQAKVADYFNRVHSTTWAYVAKNGDIYLMNRQEFMTFIFLFCILEKASSKNGGQLTVRAKTESKKMLNWLEGQI